MRKTLVCLANSYKHGGRCVAGLCVDTGQWLRLRGSAADGSLSPREVSLAEGHGEVRLLDTIEVDLHYALPSDCHPEDWVVALVPWRLVSRGSSPALWKLLEDAVDTGAPLIGGYRDRFAADELLRRPAKASLALIAPDDIWWWVRTDDHGKRKCRALFKRNHVTFDLAVTDPLWLSQLNLLPEGIYPHRTLAPKAKQTLLSISLSEAFKAHAAAGAWHYRIVAAVIVR